MTKQRLKLWLDSNTSNAAAPNKVTKTTQEVATAMGATKEATWMMLSALQSEGNAVNQGRTGSNRFDDSWSTNKTAVLP